MKIPFSPPYIDEDVEKEVLESLHSGWITTGPKVRKLEEETSKLAGVDHVLCVNSATSGMMLALHWFGIKPGDEVIVPAYTYCATALVVKHLGGVPVMVDIQDDFNIDPEKLRDAITEKTKAVIPVDFAGWPCDYDKIIKVVEAKRSIFKPSNPQQEILGRILILADAAHSIGAMYKNKNSGSLGDISVFSFHAVKNITTAEGGAICLNLPEAFQNEQIYKILKLWSLNGQTKDAFTKLKHGNWQYDVVYPGFKINMPDICAAIGLAQIKKYKDYLLPERKRIVGIYQSLLLNKKWAKCPLLETNERESSYHLFALRLKPPINKLRDKVISEAGANGIALNVHFLPLPELSVFKELGYCIKNYPVSFNNYSCEISLPVYPQLTEQNLENIVEVINNAIIKHS